MAQAAKAVPPCTSEQWPLKRYGRFVPAGTDRFGASAEAPPGSDPSASWKVFDSNDESGSLVLTIVVSGHFFISQGQTLLDKSRMFRVQFGGDSKEQALENCCHCVQKLEQYITIQVPDELSQELQPGPSQLTATESQVKDSEQSGMLHHGLHLNLKKQYASSYTFPEGRITMVQLAQSILTSAELPLAYEQAVWNAEELGPFLKLCLMDQNFPAFVEDVEKELKKLTGLEN
ncbi:meiotic recombination protein REC114 isoform X3 [Notamacropus eugenii]|uniref:meiotic recombination protein REC114 isoform X3 n=1 Tax=Notamacropus eugenii TaxID=9315 RepID=UPI003B66E992